MPHMSKYTSWYSHASSAPFSMQKNTYPPAPATPISIAELAQRGSRGLADRANNRDEVEREGDDGE